MEDLAFHFPGWKDLTRETVYTEAFARYQFCTFYHVPEAKPTLAAHLRALLLGAALLMWLAINFVPGPEWRPIVAAFLEPCTRNKRKSWTEMVKNLHWALDLIAPDFTPNVEEIRQRALTDAYLDIFVAREHGGRLPYFV